jgi:predicted nucleotidyltransferase
MDTMCRVLDHYEEAKALFPEDRVCGVWLQGSQNYGLELPTSDVDTKCIVVPTFQDIALNKKPVSTTHVRANDEHIDLKDIRLYVQTFQKQNLNFLEILWTDYFIVNPLYAEQWNRLVSAREQIARMNPYRAVKSMKGVALEKYHAMEHPYPTKLDLIEKYGFDGKQVHHLIRVDDYLTRYIAGESYESCMKPSKHLVDHMLAYKRHEIPLEAAREEAKAVLAHVEQVADNFCATTCDNEDVEMRELLQDVSYNIMKIATLKELT